MSGIFFSVCCHKVSNAFRNISHDDINAHKMICKQIIASITRLFRVVMGEKCFIFAPTISVDVHNYCCHHVSQIVKAQRL